MKKIWFLPFLFFCSLLLFGCERLAGPKIWDNCSTWNSYSIETKELEIIEDDGYDPNDVHKLNKKHIYFLNVEYQIKSWDNYIMQYYELPESKTPIYLNSFSPENARISKMQWTVLLTWYLENRMVSEWFMYETKEEMEAAPKVENWYIKYYSDWNTNPKTINLWFMRENIFPAWDDPEDGRAIVAIGSYPYFASRIDNITHFHWALSWETYWINLYRFVNDWKIHTFRLMINQTPFEWCTDYGSSFITEWDFLE